MNETASWRICVILTAVCLCLMSGIALVLSAVALHRIDNVKPSPTPVAETVRVAPNVVAATPSGALKQSLKTSLRNAQTAERKLAADAAKLSQNDGGDNVLPPLIEAHSAAAVSSGKKPKGGVHVSVQQQQAKRNDIQLARGPVVQRQASVVKVAKPAHGANTEPLDTTVASAGIGATLRKVKTLEEAVKTKKS